MTCEHCDWLTKEQSASADDVAFWKYQALYHRALTNFIHSRFGFAMTQLPDHVLEELMVRAEEELEDRRQQENRERYSPEGNPHVDNN